MRRRMEPEQLDWLRGPTRAMCVTARAGGGRSMNRKISVTSPSLCDEIAALKDRRVRQSQRSLALRSTARDEHEHQPGKPHPRRSVSDPGASPRRAESFSTRRLLTRLADDARSGRPLGSEPAAAASAGRCYWCANGTASRTRCECSIEGRCAQRKRYRSLTGRQADHRRALERTKLLRRAPPAKTGRALWLKVTASQTLRNLHAQVFRRRA